MTLYLRLRTYGDQPGVVRVALAERFPLAGYGGYLTGIVSAQTAERLAAALGLPVVRDHVPDPATTAEAKS